MVRLVRHCLLMRSVMRHGDQIRQVACAVNAECEYPFGQGRRAHSLPLTGRTATVLSEIPAEVGEI